MEAVDRDISRPLFLFWSSRIFKGCEWMSYDKELIEKAVNHIKVKSAPNNEQVRTAGEHKDLQLIAVGTDAAVFRFRSSPELAIKIFASDKLAKLTMELDVYRKIGDSIFYPKCYGSGANYMILSFEEGITLYDCIVRGISIPEQVIIDVEKARSEVLEKGLNPRDIHLKNILMYNGRAKIVDVSEYMVEGNDLRWEYLKRGYEEHYHLIDGKPVPLWIVETVRKWFNQSTVFQYEEFIKKLGKLYEKFTISSTNQKS